MEKGDKKNDPGGSIILDRIDQVLREKSLTRSDLPRLTGFTSLRLTRWFQGQGTPNVYQAIHLAKTLNVPLRWLVGDQEDRTEMIERPSMMEQAILELSGDIGPHEALRWLLDHPEIKGRIKKRHSGHLDESWVLPTKHVFNPIQGSIGEMRSTTTGERVDAHEYQDRLMREYETQKREADLRDEVARENPDNSSGPDFSNN